MRRAPIVIAGTVVGLIAVLKFHTSPVSATGGALPGGSVPAAGAAPGGSGFAGGPGSTGGGAGSSGTSGLPATGQSGAGGQTATGPSVNFYYGTLSVRATVSGGKITRIAIASLNDDSDQESGLIDQNSLPQLERQALQKQSANIQGVSGASYTSMGFKKSLQSALRSLGTA